MREFDFLTIGDITVDAFIRLKEASVNCDIDNSNCKICLSFADKVPYESVFEIPAVGNSANAAVAASRLGLRTAIATHVGDDQNSWLCIDALKKENVSTSYLKREAGKKTNYHYVLWYGDERTILVKHQEYLRSNLDLPKTKWIYLSSLGAGSENYHKKIEAYLDANSDINLIFQPGTFQMKMRDQFHFLYKRAHIFAVNVEEANRVLDVQGEKLNMKELLQKILDIGPKIVLITDGPKGAYMATAGEFFFMPPYPDPKPPLERTGAGDAFTATFASFIACGMNAKDALMRAPINSMSVVQYVGAQEGLLGKEKIEKLLLDAPAHYHPVPLE